MEGFSDGQNARGRAQIISPAALDPGVVYDYNLAVQSRLVDPDCPISAFSSEIMVRAPVRRGDTRAPRFATRTSSFQSTPPRGGRQLRRRRWSRRAGVSIHAPARGAIASWRISGSVLEVSIHAPARGAIAESYLIVIEHVYGLLVRTLPHERSDEVSGIGLIEYSDYQSNSYVECEPTCLAAVA